MSISKNVNSYCLPHEHIMECENTRLHLPWQRPIQITSIFIDQWLHRLNVGLDECPLQQIALHINDNEAKTYQCTNENGKWWGEIVHLLALKSETAMQSTGWIDMKVERPLSTHNRQVLKVVCYHIGHTLVLLQTIATKLATKSICWHTKHTRYCESVPWWQWQCRNRNWYDDWKCNASEGHRRSRWVIYNNR